MIQVPFNSKGLKIGQSGKIDWFKCNKFAQFNESQWMANKINLKQKVQYELFLLKESLGLKEIFQKFRKTSLLILIPLILILFLVMFIYIPRGSDATTQDGLTLAIAYSIITVLFVGVLIFQVSQTRKMLQTIQVGVLRLNQKLQLQGLRISVMLKKETFWQKNGYPITNRYSRIQIFEYIDY